MVGGRVSSNGSSTGAHNNELGLLRAQLTNLRALLVLSILMTESADDEQILRLAVSAASALGAWRIAGFAVGDTWRTDASDTGSVPPQLNEQLRALPETGGKVTTLDGGWAWAYPLRSIAGPIGHMVACAAGEPTREEQFLAQVVAQQTGVAVSNARLHARERAIAAELAQTNAALQETVATLRRGMQIHERLTRAQALLPGAEEGGPPLGAGARQPDRGPPHQVAVMEVTEGSPADEDVLLAARRALRQQQVPALLGTIAGTMVIVTPRGDADWEALRLATVAQLGGGGCRLGVREPYPRPSMLPSVLRE